MHSAPYFTAFGLLAVLHAVRIIRLRIRLRISIGDGNNPELQRMIRVFGNFIEYVPLGLIMLIGLEIAQAPTWYIHFCGMTLLLGRLLHAVGLSHPGPAGRARVAGMVLTFTSLFVGSCGVTLWTLFEPLASK